MQEQPVIRRRKRLDWRPRRQFKGSWLLPHAWIMPNNAPMLTYEARDHHADFSEDALYAEFRRRLVLGVFAGIAFCAAFYLWILIDPKSTRGILTILLQGIGFAGVLTLLDRLVVDLPAGAAALQNIKRDLVQGGGTQWDLITLSDADVRHFVRAKFAFVMIRAWMPFTAALALRATIITLVGINALMVPSTAQRINITVLPPGLLNNPVTALMLGVMLVILLGSLLTELIYRFQAVCAVSLLAAANAQSEHNNLGLTVSAISLVWLVELAVFLLVVLVAASSRDWIIAAITAVVGLLLLNYIFRRIRQVALAQTFKRLRQREIGT